MAQKNLLWIAIAIGAIIVLGAVYYFALLPKTTLPLPKAPLPPQTREEKTRLTIEQDLTPLELSAEERAVLLQEGVSLAEGTDGATENLQSVRSEDNLAAIEADLNETNLTGLDSELDAIDKDLQGM